MLNINTVKKKLLLKHYICYILIHTYKFHILPCVFICTSGLPCRLVRQAVEEWICKEHYIIEYWQSILRRRTQRSSLKDLKEAEQKSTSIVS